MPYRHHQILKMATRSGIRASVRRRGEACLALVWADRGLDPWAGNAIAPGLRPRAGLSVVTCSTLYPDEGEASLAPTTSRLRDCRDRSLTLVFSG
jgi:hypothetical protein